MGVALKKHLSKMELKSTDIVIFSVPLGANDAEWRGFAEGLAEDLKNNHGITTPLLVIRPGFHLDKLDEATLAEYGLTRKKAHVFNGKKTALDIEGDEIWSDEYVEWLEECLKS